MKTQKTLAVTLFILLIATNSLIAQSGDFRNVRWGMTKEQVIRTEARENVKLEDLGIMLYAKIMFNFIHVLQISYIFDGSGLIEGQYSWKYNDQQKSIYNEFKTVLQRKYGEGDYKDGIYKWSLPRTIIELHNEGVVYNSKSTYDMGL